MGTGIIFRDKADSRERTSSSRSWYLASVTRRSIDTPLFSRHGLGRHNNAWAMGKWFLAARGSYFSCASKHFRQSFPD